MFIPINFKLDYKFAGKYSLVTYKWHCSDGHYQQAYDHWLCTIVGKIFLSTTVWTHSLVSVNQGSFNGSFKCLKK